MNPSLEPNVADTPTRHRVFQVTPLSKYLAALLFICMPFIGGYIGYSKGLLQAPAATYEDTSSTATTFPPDKTTLSEEADSGPALNETITLQAGSPLHTEIREKILTFYQDEIEAVGGLSTLNPGISIAITGIAINTLFVESSFTTNGDHADAKFLLVTLDADTGVATIVREVNEYKAYYYGTPRIWTVPSPEYTKAVLVQAENAPDSLNPTIIALYDFMTGKRSVLYTEPNPNVIIAAMCDAGCTGPLYAVDNELLYCRYEKIPESLETNFIECKELLIPE